MVYKQRKGKNWWYKITWNGKVIRESTKQANKRTAETMEAAHKSALAKGEVGIREKQPVPTLKSFGEESFLPFVRSTHAAKPNTVRFFRNTVKNYRPTRRSRTCLSTRSTRKSSPVLLHADRGMKSKFDHQP